MNIYFRLKLLPIAHDYIQDHLLENQENKSVMLNLAVQKYFVCSNSNENKKEQ